MCVQDFVVCKFSILLGEYTRRKTAGLYGKGVFHFARNCHTVLHSG